MKHVWGILRIETFKKMGILSWIENSVKTSIGLDSNREAMLECGAALEDVLRVRGSNENVMSIVMESDE
jgi:hypothetical protein